MRSQSILVVNAGALFRQGLAAMLSGTAFTVHEEAITAAGLRVSDRVPEPVDLILVDTAEGPDRVGETLLLLRSRFPEAKLVVLSSVVTQATLSSAFAAGASGYLLKDISREALLECLALVAMGEKVFPTRLAEILVDIEARALEPSFMAQGEEEPLSQREWQILSCLVHGDSNKLIAKKLGITEATVKVHLKSTLRKVKARNRTQAAVWMLNRAPLLPEGASGSAGSAADGAPAASGAARDPSHRIATATGRPRHANVN